MSDWAALEALANEAMISAFGDQDPIIYQAMDGGMPAGAPVSLGAIRHVRVREEAGAVASAEDISVNPADLPVFPRRGDWVAAWGLQYVVAAVRQPDAYGVIHLALNLRAGQSANT